jgi:hypothetical protein
MALKTCNGMLISCILEQLEVDILIVLFIMVSLV